MIVLKGLTAVVAITLLGGCAGAQSPPSAAVPEQALVVVRAPPPVPPPAPTAPALAIAAGPFRLSIRDAAAWRRLDRFALDRKLDGWLKANDGSRRTGRLIATIRWRASAKRDLRRALRADATNVKLSVTLVRARLVVRPLRQAFRNSCETAALSMALGWRVSQRRLQAALARSRPLRRARTPLGDVWGDPQQGFVGGDNRAGYGVYERPLLRLARRHAPTANNLTGGTLTALVRAIAAGRPVVAWVTLGPSRPISWHTPAGRLIRADAAEHAVTVVGFTRTMIEYNDPIDGRRKAVPRAAFEVRWRALGRRAIAGPSMLR